MMIDEIQHFSILPTTPFVNALEGTALSDARYLSTVSQKIPALADKRH
jgi:hypothetical protein